MRSVAELSAEANNYNFSTSVSFRRWAHVLKSIKSRADHYASHADYEDAYILYLRWADLILYKLPTHPEFTHKRHKYDGLMKQLSSVLKHAEAVKVRLERQALEQPAYHTNTLTGGRTSSASHAVGHAQPLSPRSPRSPPHVQPPDYDITSVDTSTLQLLREPPARPATVRPHPAHPPQSEPKAIHSVRSQTEGGAPLRTLFIPATLEHEFLKIAKPNTLKRLETCGILCGKLNRNALFVTDLVIPHQENTENSCSTTNEEELFDYVESKDLIMVGWIHTHPTQSCFMSSVDLHTHNSYQLMLPEAIAIVCAPTKSPSFGAFRLTDPTGVDIIKHCSRPGFHPHDERDLYCAALPGHVRLHKYEFTVRDLR